MDFNKSKTLLSSSSHSRSLLVLLVLLVLLLHEMVFSLSLSLSLYASITLLPSSLPKRLRLPLRRLKFVKWKTRALSVYTLRNNSPSHAFLISVIPRLHRSRISLLAPPLASLATPSSFCGQRASFWEVVFLSSSSKASSRVSTIDFAVLVHTVVV